MKIVNKLVNLVHAGDQITLYPGVNEIPDTPENIKAWKEIKDTFVMKHYISQGMISVVENDDINTWTDDEFKAAIEGATDVVKLTGVLKLVKDVTRQAMIKEQIAYLAKK